MNPNQIRTKLPDAYTNIYPNLAMTKNLFHRPIIFFTILILSVLAFIIFLLLVWVLRATPDEFIFDQIHDGKKVANGQFAFDTKSGTVELINLKTRQSFLIPTKINLDSDGTCENCATLISVPQQDVYISTEFAVTKNLPCTDCVFESDVEYVDYLITRNHNGGSGGYYRHDIFRIKDNNVVRDAAYLSCGDVYISAHTLTFSHHVNDCPEFPTFSWMQDDDQWEVEFYNLRDN